MDRGARWATVHGVTNSGTQLSAFHFTTGCSITTISNCPRRLTELSNWRSSVLNYRCAGAGLLLTLQLIRAGSGGARALEWL